MGLRGGMQLVEPAGLERPHLFERAGREHDVEPRIDAAMELGAIDI